MRKPQVDPDYFTMPYLSRERWMSFWYQIMEVTEVSPKSVLEIGPGPKIVSQVLKNLRIKVITTDIDWRLKPAAVGDVTGLPFSDKSFDCVLAAQVLEHIPFAEVEEAINELARISRKVIVITLPHYSQFSPSIALKLFPFVPRVHKVFPISLFSPSHRFDGQHYWEIGKKETPLSKVKKLFTEIKDWKLARDYLIEENPYHHVFVLARV